MVSPDETAAYIQHPVQARDDSFVIPPPPISATRFHIETDFLNQYNEIAMLLENIPAWPEGLSDLIDWQAQSVAAGNGAAGQSQPGYLRFERTVASTNSLIGRTLKALLANFDGKNWEPLVGPAAVLAGEIRHEIKKIRGLIGTRPGSLDQSKIDRIFADTPNRRDQTARIL